MGHRCGPLDDGAVEGARMSAGNFDAGGGDRSVKERRAHRGAERRSFSEYHVVKSRSEPGGMAPAPSRERNEGLNGNA